MMKTIVSLKKRADFLRASRGRKYHGTFFSLHIASSHLNPTDSVSPGLDGVGKPRLGLTITKKVGTATERNRIRRRLREALRLTRLPLEENHDYVVMARRGLLSIEFHSLCQLLCKTFHELSRPRKEKRPNSVEVKNRSFSRNA